MPLYDFKCGEGHKFERFVPLSDFASPQRCECGAPSQRLVSAPAVISDVIEPRYGADGKLHDSLSSYRRSLMPEGNPRGERFFELGEDKLKTVERKPDPKALRDDIRKSIAEVKQGRRVAPTTGVVQ
jgi:putative FmdB family regulatory protein